MILLIDNYDSFTFNLVHFLGELGARCEVRRNDALTRRRGAGAGAGGDRAVARPLHAQRGRHLPRPDRRRRRADAASSASAWATRRSARRSAARWCARRRRCTARSRRCCHDGTDIFAGLPSPFRPPATTAWSCARDTLPEVLVETAWTDDGLIMGLRHRTLPVFGVQFHPESIASEHGHRILGNFLAIARGSNAPAPAPPDRGARCPSTSRPCWPGSPLGETLSDDEAEAAFGVIMSGEATPAQIAGLLMAMRVRGETVAEITGAVRAMRARMTRGRGAGRRDRRLRHRRRQRRHAERLHRRHLRARRARRAGGQARQPGAVLAHRRGGRADRAGRERRRAAGAAARRSCAPAHCAFLFAPRHHAALRHAAGPRVELGTRTIFNLLGPLANPAGVRRQLTGVFDPAWARPMAETLAALGTDACWLVHGQGLDELTVAGENQVVELRDGAIRDFTVDAGGCRAGRARRSRPSAAATRRRTPRRCVALLRGAGGRLPRHRAAERRRRR